MPVASCRFSTCTASLRHSRDLALMYGLDSALHGRLALSAVLSSSTGGLALLLALCSSDEILRLGAALAACAFLPLARLLGCAVATRIRPRLGSPNLRQVILEILSFFFTTLSSCLFAASLGESETWDISRS
eukprot:s541_g18.t1